MESKLDVIYEDESLLVINKPAGLVVNLSETTKEGTLQNLILERYPRLFEESENSEFVKRSGIVHRLDKETSGVMVVAKDEGTFEDLKKQFQERQVEKEYIALVIGRVEENLIEVNAPVARNPKNRLKVAVVRNGREAVTVIEKMREIKWQNMTATLVKVYPKTGRMHQIRVHLAALDHPVVGDNLYAGRKRSVSSREYFGRLMLHSRKISFSHPLKKEKVIFEALTPSEFSTV